MLGGGACYSACSRSTSGSQTTYMYVHVHCATHTLYKYMSRIPTKLGFGGSCTCTRDMMEYQLLLDCRIPLWNGHSYPILRVGRYMYHGPAWDCRVHPTMYFRLVGRFVGALFACVMCLAVYMCTCILCFSFPDCSRSDGRALVGVCMRPKPMMLPYNHLSNN